MGPALAGWLSLSRVPLRYCESIRKGAPIFWQARERMLSGDIPSGSRLKACESRDLPPKGLAGRARSSESRGLGRAAHYERLKA